MTKDTITRLRTVNEVVYVLIEVLHGTHTSGMQ